jgi:UDP-N-acetylmuramyl pentapeptide synthase
MYQSHYPYTSSVRQPTFTTHGENLFPILPLCGTFMVQSYIASLAFATVLNITTDHILKPFLHESRRHHSSTRGKSFISC